ncbi:gluconokinase [Microbacterium sp. NPDC055903]
MTQSAVSIVVMGVQGTGKSTVGRLLAERLGVPFVDGDDLHPARNIELMAAGTPLTDADREPWLHLVGQTLVEGAATGGVVVACSALRRRYRDLIRDHDADAYFVETWGPIELIAQRVGARDHQYMPSSLLQSQFATLEPLADDENGIRLSVTAAPDAIVDDALSAYRARERA